MSGLRAWWRGLSPFLRWLMLAALLVVASIALRLWLTAAFAFAAMVASVIERASGRPAAADAESRARTATDLQAASARLMAEVHRSEHDAARVRDREADRAMVEAADRAAVAPHVEQDAPPAFLAEVERRGGRP